MDHSLERQSLKRASVESAEHVANARQSVEITREHIAQSRSAIARSFELLALRFSTFRD